MENKPFESILNYLKDENVIDKKEFDYLNNDEEAAKNSILYYYDNVDDPNVNMLVEMNWDYFLELEEE
jgi:NADPH-dependent curcumin reductase CurA